MLIINLLWSYLEDLVLYTYISPCYWTLLSWTHYLAYPVKIVDFNILLIVKHRPTYCCKNYILHYILLYLPNHSTFWLHIKKSRWLQFRIFLTILYEKMLIENICILNSVKLVLYLCFEYKLCFK